MRVEVPAVLTKEHVEAWEYLKQRNDAYLREVGTGSAALLSVLESKIKVYIYLDDVLRRLISGGQLAQGYRLFSVETGSWFCPLIPKILPTLS